MAASAILGSRWKIGCVEPAHAAIQSLNPEMKKSGGIGELASQVGIHSPPPIHRFANWSPA
jgi:hypothetical protein